MCYCFFINRVNIILNSKKQYIILIFIIETKYIKLEYRIYKKEILIEIFILFENNKTSILITKNIKN